MGKRVGTLSMAILLILSGIMMVLSQYINVSFLDLSLKFWPMILFLLGIEILWRSHAHKNGEKIQYDLFSIFIIFIILMGNIGLYTLVQLDLTTKVNTLITSQMYSLKTSVETIGIDDTVEKIVIENANFSPLTLRTHDENQLTGSGNIDVEATSLTEAKKVIEPKYLSTHQEGHILYVSFVKQINQTDSIQYAHVDEYTLIVPTNKQVEVNNVNDINILLDGLNNNWIVDNSRHTTIRLAEDINVAINAWVDDSNDLGGNVKWNVLSNDENQQNNGCSNKNILAQMVQGNGTYKIKLLNPTSLKVHPLLMKQKVLNQ